MMLKILGCGTSTGVPIPGCRCAVCTSGNPKNERLRASAVIRLDGGQNILIDTSTDLRQQALRYDIQRVDAVLYTHAHADHIMGLDDLRCFNFTTHASIPCYATKKTLERLKDSFRYVFEPDPHWEGGLLPQISTHEIGNSSPFKVCGVEIRPFALEHGRIEVLGFRVGSVAYATDCKRISDHGLQVLRGVRHLVLDGLRYEQHPSHLSIAEAIKLAGEIGAETTYLTHTTHSVDYDAVTAQLPGHVRLAYDGLEIPITP